MCFSLGGCLRSTPLDLAELISPTLWFGGWPPPPSQPQLPAGLLSNSFLIWFMVFFLALPLFLTSSVLLLCEPISWGEGGFLAPVLVSWYKGQSESQMLFKWAFKNENLIGNRMLQAFCIVKVTVAMPCLENIPVQPHICGLSWCFAFQWVFFSFYMGNKGVSHFPPTLISLKENTKPAQYSLGCS